MKFANTRFELNCTPDGYGQGEKDMAATAFGELNVGSQL